MEAVAIDEAEEEEEDEEKPAETEKKDILATLESSLAKQVKPLQDKLVKLESDEEVMKTAVENAKKALEAPMMPVAPFEFKTLGPGCYPGEHFQVTDDKSLLFRGQLEPSADPKQGCAEKCVSQEGCG